MARYISRLVEVLTARRSVALACGAGRGELVRRGELLGGLGELVGRGELLGGRGELVGLGELVSRGDQSEMCHFLLCCS